MNNINNFYIYNNVINNYYIYNTGFQAGVASASASASASETFERLRIDVCQYEKEHSCEDASSCSICQNEEQEEEEEEEKEMVTTKCNHVFHSECLKQWVLIKTTCPMCRASLIKN